jgi:preprotein translocase subunit SecB
MDVKVQPILKFQGIDIVNVNVNLINSFDHEKQPPIDMTIVPKVFYPEDRPNNFTIIVDLKVSSKDFFNISIVAFGGFSLNKSTNEADSKPFININAPAIMFPYVRSFLSTLTANLGAGFPPIILPPHFFQGEMEEYKPIVQQDQQDK